MMDQQQLVATLVITLTLQLKIKVNSGYGYSPIQDIILSLGTLKIDSPAQFDEPDWTDARVRWKMYPPETRNMIGWLISKF